MFKGSRCCSALLSFLPSLPPFILCVLTTYPFIHRAKVLCTRGCCKAEMVSRPRPRRTFRCGDENNYALSSLSSSMCAKLCSLGSTWPGKGSLVTLVVGVAAAAAAAAVARPSARSHGAGGRASARANAVTRSMGQSLSARSLARFRLVCPARPLLRVCACVVYAEPPSAPPPPPLPSPPPMVSPEKFVNGHFFLDPIKSCPILRLTRTNT